RHASLSRNVPRRALVHLRRPLRRAFLSQLAAKSVARIERSADRRAPHPVVCGRSPAGRRIRIYCETCRRLRALSDSTALVGGRRLRRDRALGASAHATARRPELLQRPRMTLTTGEYAFGVAVGFVIAISPTVG